MATLQSATSVRISHENVEKLTNFDDMLKAFDELTNEEVCKFHIVLIMCCHHRSYRLFTGPVAYVIRST